MRQYQCHRVVVAIRCWDAVFLPDGTASVKDKDGTGLTLAAKTIAARTEQEVRSGYAYRDWDGKTVRWMKAEEFDKHYTMLPER
jgi:hypothetical protein